MTRLNAHPAEPMPEPTAHGTGRPSNPRGPFGGPAAASTAVGAEPPRRPWLREALAALEKVRRLLHKALKDGGDTMRLEHLETGLRQAIRAEHRGSHAAANSQLARAMEPERLSPE